jgi:hypothetical protein
MHDLFPRSNPSFMPDLSGCGVPSETVHAVTTRMVAAFEDLVALIGRDAAERLGLLILFPRVAAAIEAGEKKTRGAGDPAYKGVLAITCELAPDGQKEAAMLAVLRCRFDREPTATEIGAAKRMLTDIREKGLSLQEWAATPDEFKKAYSRAFAAAMPVQK